MPTRPTAGSDAKSSRYLRLFLAITLGFGVLHVGSLLAYLYWPQSFYHRHLEYLLDIGYRVKGASLSWQGPEQGDLGRKHLITYSETYDNKVTVDEEGFRSRKVDAATYPVLVSGDSTIYGILLNDQETLPWRLSASLGVPVFNGGRVSLSNLLAHPAIQATEIVIDGWTERRITPEFLTRDSVRPQRKFEPIARRNLSLMEAVSDVPPRRYSLPLRLFNILGRLYKDVRTIIREGKQQYLYERHKMRADELDKTIALIVARTRTVEALGKRYVFVPIPAKQNFYAENVDDYTRRFIPTLVARLRQEGVEAVDLTVAFHAAKDLGLFFPYDTHWNSTATRIADRVITREVFGRTK